MICIQKNELELPRKMNTVSELAVGIELYLMMDLLNLNEL